MLAKHLKLPKFYAPSKVLTLGAKEFSGEGTRSVKTFAKYPGESLAEIKLRVHRMDWIGVADQAPQLPTFTSSQHHSGRVW